MSSFTCSQEIITISCLPQWWALERCIKSQVGGQQYNESEYAFVGRIWLFACSTYKPVKHLIRSDQID